MSLCNTSIHSKATARQSDTTPLGSPDHQAPIGYIVAVVRLGDTMNTALPAAHAAKRGVHVPEEDQLLFRVDPPEVTQAVQSRTKNVTVAGRSWQIDFSPGLDYAPDLQTSSVLVGVGCLATAITPLWLGNITRHNVALKREASQRTLAESALAVSEERLRLTVDSSSSGSWDWNFNTMELVLSDEFLRWIGYEPGEIEQDAETIRKMVHPDDQTRFTEALWTHIRTPGLPPIIASCARTASSEFTRSAAVSSSGTPMAPPHASWG